MHVVLGHSHWVNGHAHGIEVQGSLAALVDFGEALVAPVFAPGVLHDPDLAVVGESLPPHDLD